jgi:hypothetical protein
VCEVALFVTRSLKKLCDNVLSVQNLTELHLLSKQRRLVSDPALMRVTHASAAVTPQAGSVAVAFTRRSLSESRVPRSALQSVSQSVVYPKKFLKLHVGVPPVPDNYETSVMVPTFHNLMAGLSPQVQRAGCRYQHGLTTVDT